MTVDERYAMIGRFMCEAVEALSDAGTDGNVPRDDAMNAYISAHAALKTRAESAEAALARLEDAIKDHHLCNSGLIGLKELDEILHPEQEQRT